MSDTTFPLSPPPIDFGDMGNMDEDKNFGLDCTRNMQARGTTITGVVLGEIDRADGDVLDAGDIAVSNIDIVNGGFQFGWTITANGNCAVYYITFIITLANSSVIQRTIVIEVKPYVG